MNLPWVAASQSSGEGLQLHHRDLPTRSPSRTTACPPDPLGPLQPNVRACAWTGLSDPSLTFPHTPPVPGNPVCCGLWWYFEVVRSSCLRPFLSVWAARRQRGLAGGPPLVMRQQPRGGRYWGLWRFRVTQVLVVGYYSRHWWWLC